MRATGALPLISAVYSSDPRVLPIVYDVPSCESIANTTLLDCPRLTQFPTNNDDDIDPSARLGFLVDPIVGVDALVAVVGVSCEGTYTTFDI